MSMARPLDENQGPSQSHGHGPWLVCEVAPKSVAFVHEFVSSRASLGGSLDELHLIKHYGVRRGR